MGGILIAFTLSTGKDKARSSKFSKAFFGQATSSHGGKYRYRRRGFLDEIPYVKLIRGVIIVRKEDAAQILNFLQEFGTKTYVREVILTPEDKEALVGSGPSQK